MRKIPEHKLVRFEDLHIDIKNDWIADYWYLVVKLYCISTRTGKLKKMGLEVGISQEKMDDFKLVSRKKDPIEYMKDLFGPRLVRAFQDGLYRKHMRIRRSGR